MVQSVKTQAPLDVKFRHLLAPGHSACIGCGELLGARLVIDAAGPNVIVVTATSCLEITTSRFPESAWRVPWIHSLFENVGAVASGIEAALKALGRSDEAKVLAFAGDGGTADIGLQALSGMLERGHDVLFVCFDNEAYMNTGIQRSGLTPLFARTTTSPPGAVLPGKTERKKDIVAIVAAHNVPYIAVTSVGFPQDVQKRVKKALSIKGPKFIHLHVPCNLGWGFDAAYTIKVSKLAVQTALFPLYEIENGVAKSTRAMANRLPVEEYLKLQKRFDHVFKPGNETLLAQIQAVADANAKRLGLPPVSRSGPGDDTGD